MKKQEVVEIIAAELDETQAYAGRVLDTVLDTIRKGIVEDGEVSFMGFGKFETQERKAREGRNPQTGAPMIIPASTTVKFKVGKALKEAVNK